MYDNALVQDIYWISILRRFNYHGCVRLSCSEELTLGLHRRYLDIVIINHFFSRGIFFFFFQMFIPKVGQGPGLSAVLVLLCLVWRARNGDRIQHSLKYTDMLQDTSLVTTQYGIYNI